VFIRGGIRFFGQSRFLSTIPARKSLAVNTDLPWYFHGMEEVVGSIPTRSTDLISHLPAINSRRMLAHQCRGEDVRWQILQIHPDYGV